MPNRSLPTQCLSAAILYQRIDKIVELIPDDFPEKRDLVQKLRDRQNSIYFTEERAVTERWKETEDILGKYLPDPNPTNWTGIIAKIFKTEL